MDIFSLGQFIAGHRKAQRLTQAGLARRAGVGRSTLDALENGRTGELGYGKIIRLLAALDLTIKIAAANQGRPTLDDLRGQADEPE